MKPGSVIVRRVNTYEEVGNSGLLRLCLKKESFYISGVQPAESVIGGHAGAATKSELKISLLLP